MKKSAHDKKVDAEIKQIQLKKLGTNGYKEAAKSDRVTVDCKMCTMVHKSKKDYSRKLKHKKKYSELNY